MRIIVMGTEAQLALLKKSSDPSVEWLLADSFMEEADLYLRIESEGIITLPLRKPVILNSVSRTLADIGLGPNVYRINGWNSFLSREVWEIAGEENDELNSLAALLGKKFKWVSDEPGFIAARVISMIINEAYFALEENVSTKAEMDTAMKLGTNYPYGPFEWSELIGLPNIYELLSNLAKTDNRFVPSSLLTKEALLV